MFTKSGKPAGRILVRPGKRTDFARARVIWPGNLGQLDAALLEITDGEWRPPDRVQRMRLGRITGAAAGVPCSASGFPRVSSEPRLGRDTEQLSGLINPGDQLRGQRYQVNLTSSLPDQPSGWVGVSGAALFAGDLLIGVVTSVAQGFGSAKLIAEPSFRLGTDPGFAAVMHAFDAPYELESAELAEMFQPVRSRSGDQSRTRMLDAAVEVVPFRGREQILGELRSWCDTSYDFAAGLIVGPGGQGKTRLAHELCQLLRSQGWVAGLVYDRVPAAVISQLGETAKRVLLVIDMAETRGPQITELVDVIRRRPDHAPAIRLLMLARSAGDWWHQLSRKMPDLLAAVPCTELPELEDSTTGRLEAYHEALRAFADRLTEADPAVAWLDILSQVADPDMVDSKPVSVLTLHMTALTALLQKAGPSLVESSLGQHRVEDVLLNYEMAYWAAGELPGSPKTDVLCRVVAAAMLCGAARKKDACDLLRLRDIGRPERPVFAEWIHGLYPVPSDRYWGYLQPDRVGEHLIRRVADSEPDFLDAVDQAASADQRIHATAVFARIAGRLEEVEMLDEARKWYRRAAESGHNDAACKLGNLLKSGEPAEAVQWYERAAVAGHNDAAYELGELLKSKEPAEARKWYARAAVSGHNHAAYTLGELCWQEGRPAEARKWFMRAAANEHVHAAYQLGWLLLKTEDDPAGAAFWWRIASEGGDLNASFELGELLTREGKPDRARHWYERAAELGHNQATYQLGGWLWGEGDLPGAKHWYEQAAKAGHADAASQLGWLLFKTEDDQAGAISWWLQAAELGQPNPEAAAELGGLLARSGQPVEAMRWYQEAAEAGHRDAAFELGELLWRDEKPREASPWFERAARDGDTRAACQLGWLLQAEEDRAGAAYWWGVAVEQGDRGIAFALAELLWQDGRQDEARRLYDQAAHDGNLHAAYQLGWLLEGQGDHDGAMHWWRLAAERGSEDAQRLLSPSAEQWGCPAGQETMEGSQ